MIVGRSAEQRVLKEALRCVPKRGGQLVLVRGEAGIGKSTFIEHFLAEVPAEHDAAFSWCDPLKTPRPLGPIRELATTVGDDTDTLLTEEDLFEGFVSDVQAGRSTRSCVENS
ncbi:ATP-binding protein [Rhodobacteraceae bacterium]|nr:ATP-binding protein [Paracoccaceae bacterium]